MCFHKGRIKKNGKKITALLLFCAIICTAVPIESKAEERVLSTDNLAQEQGEISSADDFAPEGEEQPTAGGTTQEQEAVLPAEPTGQKEALAPDGLVWQESHYILFLEGAQVTEEGWKEVSGVKFYVDSSGFVSSKLEQTKEGVSLFKFSFEKAEWVQQKNEICVLDDGRMYYFNSSGNCDTAEGWKEVSQTEIYYVNGSGFVASRLEKFQQIWRCFDYNDNTLQWEKQTDIWKTVGEQDYYFNSKGNCTTIYHKGEHTCQTYSNGKMTTVKKGICMLQDGKLYYFNSKGLKTTNKGWQKASSQEYIQIGKNGTVISKMKKQKQFWEYYDYNYQDVKWERQKNVWKKVFDKEYYFSKSGNCIRIYDLKTKKCKEYSKGNMRNVKKKIVKLHNGRLYYFNSKGVKAAAKGWNVVSSTSYVQVGKGGYVTSKMQRKKEVWRFYRRNYHTEKWEKQKNVWKNVRKSKYYFNKKGNCTRIYDTAAQKCYDVKGGKEVLVQSAVRKIGKTKYYFGSDGRKAASAGMYLSSSGRIICTDQKGRVTKEISGQVLSYESWQGKITSCRVQEGRLICYYDGDGTLRRKIDLDKPMVALTYDDGPSQYTSVILDILGQYGGAATFFVLGQRVPGYADTIRRAHNMGCEIGNHTYSHQILTKIGTPQIQSQIYSTNAAVKNIIGVSPVVMRPPGGGQNPSVRSAVGMPLILWSIDTLDWKTRNASSTQAAILNHVKDGDIILMHDLYSPTAEASKAVIPELVRRGYQLLTVSELAECRGGMAKGAVYNAFRR